LDKRVYSGEFEALKCTISSGLFDKFELPEKILSGAISHSKNHIGLLGGCHAADYATGFGGGLFPERVIREEAYIKTLVELGWALFDDPEDWADKNYAGEFVVAVETAGFFEADNLADYQIAAVGFELWVGKVWANIDCDGELPH
jgi:hypothetical protein